jgi:hypothetical protein
MFIVDASSPLFTHIDLINKILDPLYSHFGGQLKNVSTSSAAKKQNLDGITFQCEFLEEPEQIIFLNTGFSLYAGQDDVDKVILITTQSENEFSKSNVYEGLADHLRSSLSKEFDDQFNSGK